MKNLKMTNETYDFLKKALVIGVPSVITLISGLGELYGFNSALITGTIALFATFFGSVLQISSQNYNNDEK